MLRIYPLPDPTVAPRSEAEGSPGMRALIGRRQGAGGGRKLEEEGGGFAAPFLFEQRVPPPPQKSRTESGFNGGEGAGGEADGTSPARIRLFSERVRANRPYPLDLPIREG